MGLKLESTQETAEEVARLKDLCAFEHAARARGFTRIAGVDEAGRGPLAGPVVAAACIIPEGLLIPGVDDSKKLRPSERHAVFQRIRSLAEVSFAIGIVEAAVIDQINILRATFEAMILAISRLTQAPDFLLIDGNRMPPTPIPGEVIVKGDSRSQSIAAASIIAKETRDQLMSQYHAEWPQYNFLSNKGYGTKEHLLAIEKYGPCPIHRMSFYPVKVG